jgi:hypothetical protein
MGGRFPFLVILPGLFEIMGAIGLANGFRRAWKAGRSALSGFSLLDALRGAGFRALFHLFFVVAPLVVVMKGFGQQFVLPVAAVGLVAFIVVLITGLPFVGSLAYRRGSALAAGAFVLAAGISMAGYFAQTEDPFSALFGGGCTIIMGAVLLISTLHSMATGSDE